MADEFDKMFGATPKPDEFGTMFGGAPKPPVPAEPRRSALGEIATGIRTGFTEEVPEMVGKAMQWAGEPGIGGIRQDIFEAGKGIAERAEARSLLPENIPQPEGRGAITRAFAEGGRMLGPSIAAPLAIGAGLALLPEAAIGAGTALGISALAGAVPMAMAQGQETLERVREAGGTEEAARAAGWKNLFIEGLGESVGTYAGGKFIGVAGKALGKAVAPGVAGTVAAATDTAVLKPFAKSFIKTALVETGTEIGQAGAQALVEREAGVDVNPWEQMKSVVGPTLALTTFLAPFGLHASMRNSRKAQAVDQVLADPAIPAEQRQAVVEAINIEAKNNNVPAAEADAWMQGAMQDIETGLPIRREVATAETGPSVQEELLINTVPGAVSAKIVDDQAEIVIRSGAGVRIVKAPVADIAKMVAAKEPVEALAPERKAPTFERLQDIPTAPDVVRYRIRDKEYTYEPAEGMTRQEMDTAIAEKKTPAAQVTWLRKNAVLRETKDIGVEPVMPTAPPSPLPTALPTDITPEQELLARTAPPIQGEIDATIQPMGIEGVVPQAVQAGARQAAPGRPAPRVPEGVQPTVGTQAEPQIQQREGIDVQIPPTVPGATPTGAVPTQELQDVGRAVVPDTLAQEPIAIVDSRVDAASVLNRQGLQQTHEIIEQPDGKFAVLPRQAPITPGKEAPAPPSGAAAALPDQAPAAQVSPDIRYDGTATGIHYFTIESGQGQGATFATKTTEPTEIKRALKETREKFPEVLKAEGTAGASTTAKVTTELKSFLGRGYDNLVRKGKLSVVQSINALPENIRGRFLNMVAWHGTPHDVDRFSTEKIGTGEGAQAYGYGLYFAGKRSVAEWYRKKLTDVDRQGFVYRDLSQLLGDGDYVYASKEDLEADSRPINKDDGTVKKVYVDRGGGDFAVYEKQKDGTWTAPKGRLYQVELAPQEDEYLLWDRPLSEQSEKVKAAILGEYTKVSTEVTEDSSKSDREKLSRLKRMADAVAGDREFSGAQTYGSLRYSFGRDDKAVSEYLHSLGIRGVKYLAGTSRAAGEGDYNYVIFSDQDITITAIYSQDGGIAGAYDTRTGKVYLVAGNMKEGDAKYVMLHEASHALLLSDKTFMVQREKILKEFNRLGKTTPSVQDAYAQVPEDTAEGYRDIEAIAYWLQNKENHKHSLFKRIISAIKAALIRLGIAPGKMTESDMAALFVQGTQAWARQGEAAKRPAAEKPEVLMSRMSDTLQQGRKTLGTAMGSLANPKSKAYDLYVQYAPNWLSVTPLNTLVQTFGKKILQIVSFAKNLDSVVAGKTEIVDTAAVLHDKAVELAEKGVGVDILNKAAEIATFNQMNPWAGILQQDWMPETGTPDSKMKAANTAWKKARMDKSTGLSFTEAYHESANAYNALKTEELKDAYISVVEHLKSIRVRERNNLLAYIEAVTEKGSKERLEMMNQFHAAFSEIKGAYWPLERIGDFVLKYVDPEGFTWSRNFSTIAERKQATEDIIKAGVDPATITETYKDKQPRGAVAIPQQLMDQIGKTVRNKYLEGVDQSSTEAVATAMDQAQDVINDMTQIWLRWQPETSALKNNMQRKNVKGASEDMMRSYLSYMQRHASSIAWTEQGRKIEADIKGLADDILEKNKSEAQVDTTMDRHILNDLRNRIQALRSVQVGVVASTLGKLGTAYYMTSPSIALVQMSQLAVLTLPRLSTNYGIARASKAMTKGTKDAFSRKYTRAPMFADIDVNYVYENLRAVVTDENRNLPAAKGKELGDRLFSDAQIIAQINDKLKRPEQKKLLVLREAMARNLLDISAAHEAYELTRGKDPNSLGRKIFNLAMLPMSLSELASRKATVLATYDLATQDGQDFFMAMNDIGSVVNDTLFSYSKENKGAAMQGGLTRVLLQFQHYRIMTGIRLAMLFKNSVKGETPEIQKQAAKEFIGIMGMTGALAGTLGIPLSKTLFAAINLVFGDEDEPYDAELEFTNWLRDQLGQTGADVVAKGLPTLLGMDISRRIGLADIYGSQSDPPARLHGKELAAWWAASQLGPVFSVGSSWVQGYDQMVNKGNYMHGLEDATPKPIRDVLKAIRIGTEGVKTRAGKKLLADEDIGPDELIMQALGFNTDEISNAQTASRKLYTMGTKISERRGKLIRNAARALLEDGDIDSALDDIQTFNSKMPRFAVFGSDIRPAVRKLVMGELGVTGPREFGIAEKFGIEAYSVW